MTPRSARAQLLVGLALAGAACGRGGAEPPKLPPATESASGAGPSTAAAAPTTTAQATPAASAPLGPSRPPPEVAPGLAPSDDPAPMTVSRAGGACAFGAPVVIGPSAKDVRVSLAFGAKAGLVAWIDDGAKLRLRPLDPSGAPAGPLLEGHPVGRGERPFGIEPLGADFVVTVARAEAVGGTTVYHRRAVLVRPDARLAGSFSEVGAPDLWIRLPRTESRGGHFAFVGSRGEALKAAQPAMWIETSARSDGTIVEEARPVEPPLTTDMGEARARVRGEGPLAILLAKSRVVVVQGRATRIKNASLARIDARERTLTGAWVSGGGRGLLGGPDRHLRIAWFEGGKVHAANVRADGTTTAEQTSAPLAPLPDLPDEIEVWGGGRSNSEGFAPSFSRRRVFLPATKTVRGVLSPEPRFELARIELEGGKILPIENGAVQWSGTHVVYVYREGRELKSRAAVCSGP